jgi:spore coat protein U-like protein
MNKIKLLIALAILPAFNLANASTATAPMQVTATVDPKCTISANNMDFGSIQLNSTSVILTTMLSAQCTNGTTYSVSFDAGVNANSGGYRLKHATLSQYLSYTLTTQSNQPINPNQIFYNGTGTGTGSGTTPTTIFIQGSLNTSANVTPGKFSDTLTVTVTY